MVGSDAPAGGPASRGRALVAALDAELDGGLRAVAWEQGGDARLLYGCDDADPRSAFRRVVETRTAASARTARGGGEGSEYAIHGFAGVVVVRLAASVLSPAWTGQIALCVDRDGRTLGDVTAAVERAVADAERA